MEYVDRDPRLEVLLRHRPSDPRVWGPSVCYHTSGVDRVVSGLSMDLGGKGG